MVVRKPFPLFFFEAIVRLSRWRRLEHAALVVIIVFFLIRCRNVFYARFQPEIFLSLYDNFISGRIGGFSDEVFYALAGWKYVHGSNLDIMTLSHPPLAIYMIGLSELLFMNHVMLGLFVSVFTLIMVYSLSKRVIFHSPIALVPVFLLSLDKMYIWLSSIAWLDIYATFFASLSLLLLLNKRSWARPLLYVSIGLALSCKWNTVFLVALPPLYYVLKKDWNQLKFYPLFMTLTFLTYLSTYAVFFLQGHTLQDFVTLQWNMFAGQRYERFNRGTPPPFWLLLNFLTGIEGPTAIKEVFANMDTRTFTVIAKGTGLSLIAHYNPLTWPLLFSSSILTLYYSRNGDRSVVPLSLGLLVFLAVFSTGQLFIWYMLPVFPLGFVCLGYVINMIYFESTNKKTVKVILIAYLALAVAWSLFVVMPPYIWLTHSN